MAARYWVGGTGTWDNSTTTHWAASSGGGGGETVPGASDTVIFDGSSGGGKITLNYSPSVVSITGGAHTGEFDTGNNNITVQTFSYTGTGTRTLTLGSSTITVTGNNATIINFATITGMTMTANTATFDCTYSGSTGTRTIAFGAFAETTSPSLKISAGSDATTITAARTFKNLDFTGYSGTTANTVKLLYGNLTIEGAATYTAGASAITFAATSGTQTITSDGKTLDFPITINAPGATVQLADNLTMGTARTLNLTGGTFDINGKALSVGIFLSNNGNVRTFADILTGGSITITGSGTTIFNTSNSQNLSLTTIPVINCNYSGSTGTRIIGCGTSSYGTESNTFTFNITAGTDGLDFTASSKYVAIDTTGWSGTLTNRAITVYGNLTIPTGTITDGANAITLAPSSGTKTLNIAVDCTPITINGTGTVQLGANLTITSARTLTLTAGNLDINGKALSIGAFSSSGSGTRSLKDVATGGSITITGNNATVWTTATATNLSYTTPPVIDFNYSGSTGTRTITRIGTPFNVSAGTDALTVGTYPGVGNLDANNFNGWTGTSLTLQAIQCTNFDISGTTATTLAGSGTVEISGNFVMKSGITNNFTSYFKMTATSGTKTITTNGVDIKIVYIDGSGGTFRLEDNLNITNAAGGGLGVVNGTLDTNNKVLNICSLDMSGGTLSLGNATHLLNGPTGNIWNVTGGTISTNTSTIKYNGALTGDVTFTGGSKDYNGANFWNATTNAFSCIIADSNTFANFKVDAGRTQKFTDGTTTTITSLTATGTSGSKITLAGTSTGGWTISDSAGTNTVSYCTISYSTAQGGAVWDAMDGTNTNGGHNTGWDFPLSSGNFFSVL